MTDNYRKLLSQILYSFVNNKLSIRLFINCINNLLRYLYHYK